MANNDDSSSGTGLGKRVKNLEIGREIYSRTGNGSETISKFLDYFFPYIDRLSQIEKVKNRLRLYRSNNSTYDYLFTDWVTNGSYMYNKIQPTNIISINIKSSNSTQIANYFGGESNDLSSDIWTAGYKLSLIVYT